MKKFLALLLATIMLLSATACNKQATDQSTNQSADQSSDVSSEQLTDEPEEKEEDEPHKTITLEPDNEYMKVSLIDISDCKLEDGYFSGTMTYVSETTQKYIDEYYDYGYRQIYFRFYNENGDLLGDAISQNNCVYDREYVWDGQVYVSFSTKYDVAEVKVYKIVCQT